MKKIKIGLVGAGFMGGAHSQAFNNIVGVYGSEIVPEFEIVADVSEENAKKLAADYGYKRWTTNWQDVIDAGVDLIDVVTPNKYHAEVSIAAAKAGIPIYCEKPLAMDGAEAQKMVDAVKDNNVLSFVGFNYIHNPVHALAKKMIDSGELGKVVAFRGTFDQDYYSEKDTKHTWRMLQSQSATGAIGDLGAHTLSLSQYLLGDIDELVSILDIAIAERPSEADENKMLPVENDDIAQVMYKYDSGVLGFLSTNRVASGRRLSLTYEIQGTEGSIYYDQERQNELKIYRRDDLDPMERGFKTVLIDPSHGDYAHFFGGAGIGLGYNDVKTIEAYQVLKSVAENKPSEIDFAFGGKINTVIDAVLESNDKHAWVKVKK